MRMQRDFGSGKGSESAGNVGKAKVLAEQVRRERTEQMLGE